MRYKRFSDIEGLNEHFPRRIVEAKDSLVFLDVVLTLLGHATGFRWYYRLLARKCETRSVTHT